MWEAVLPAPMESTARPSEGESAASYSVVQRERQIGSEGQDCCVVRRGCSSRHSAARPLARGVEVAGLHSPMGAIPKALEAMELSTGRERLAGV